ncbi:unnamed protein product [Dovyalis caffra]|uniref:Pentatricopeptide repeat-containing protein n=1 Tax=Dovyalis caffra TaxID=77055 RepID=A0AAV1QWM6_9ROSI|nr:unnamed protein product [Dovyalis caffra]
MLRIICKIKRFNASFIVSCKHFCSLVNATKKTETITQHDLFFDVTKVSKLHSLLQFCAKNRESIKGKACHGQVIRLGLETDTLTSNMLMNVYSKCGLIRSACKVFDGMPGRSMVSWNTMIGTCVQNGEEEKAIEIFLEMQREGSPCSEFTVSSVICACAAKGGVFLCRQLHAFAIKAVMDANVFVGTALLDVYAKSGLIEEASCVFEGMPERSDVTWSSMVAGYVQNELYEEGLVLFARGKEMGLEYNQFMISSVIRACAGLASLIEGRHVHAIVCRTGFGPNNFVASALVDMYAKCGSIKEAYVVFCDIERKNVVLWNVMISGFAKHACFLEVMNLFEEMQQMGMHPDEVTYASVLSACNHVGLVDKGRSYFELMTREHHLSPNAIHYSCMVDILGRGGPVREAHELMTRMPFAATASMWGSLLASCRIHGNLELAEIAAKKLFEMEPDSGGNYVLLANTYAASKKWEEAAKARKFLKEIEVMKERGKSWIEIKDKVHIFMSDERTHPRITDIYLELDNLLEEMTKVGNKAESDCDLHDL